MIQLVKLIELAGIKLGNWKIHCAMNRVNPPLDHFFAGTFKEWQEDQNNKNFDCDTILSLIQLNKKKYLFAGVWSVLGVRKRAKPKPTLYKYATKEVVGLEHLVGRTIINFDKKFRATYLKGDRWANQLIVSEIKDQRMTIEDFKGYKSVLLSYDMLDNIIKNNQLSWKTALKNVSGVYVISDKRTGKLYIGSAYGFDGIWNRWSSYVKNGHGNNKTLKDLIEKKGIKYAQMNFQFSLLEVCDVDVSKDDVIKKENHWKEVLQTRKYGYNEN